MLEPHRPNERTPLADREKDLDGKEPSDEGAAQEAESKKDVFPRAWDGAGAIQSAPDHIHFPSWWGR